MKLCILSFSPVNYYTLSIMSKQFSVYVVFANSHNMTISLKLWRWSHHTLRSQWERCIYRQCNIKCLCVPCPCFEELFHLSSKTKKKNDIISSIILIFTDILLYFIYIVVKHHDDSRKRDRNLQVNINII